MLFQITAHCFGQILFHKDIDHIRCDALDHIVFFFGVFPVVVGCDEILEQLCEQRKLREGPHSAEAPFIIWLIDPVQQKNGFHCALYKVEYSHLCRTALPVEQTSLIIVLTGLRHEKQMRSKFFPSDVFRIKGDPFPDGCDLAVIVRKDLSFCCFGERLRRNGQPL